MVQRIAINGCFGGFGLSDKAIKRYAEIKGMTLDKVKDDPFGGHYEHKGKYFSDRDISRDDPVLHQVIEELGEEVHGMCAELLIIEIPDGVDWIVEEYDGNEHVAEKHRTWR